MRTYRTISVELTNYATFEPYSGAIKFQSEFASNLMKQFYFRFYEENVFNLALKRLNELDLKFQVY